jgi:superfamily II DNA/RNA helicase
MLTERVFISKLRHIVIDESDSMMAKDFKEELMKLFIPVKVRNVTIDPCLFRIHI